MTSGNVETSWLSQSKYAAVLRWDRAALRILSNNHSLPTTEAVE